MKAKRWVDKRNVYENLGVMDESKAAEMNKRHARRIVEMDEPDFAAGQILLIDADGSVKNLRPIYLYQWYVEVDVEIPDPTENYSI
jgi:hypothetical protein